MTTRWWQYVETNLRNRGLKTGDLTRVTGVDRSRISEWKRGRGVSLETARAVARLFEVSPLEAWVAAELITDEEARLQRARPDPADLTDQELVAELTRRLERTRD
ncbi:helix-turn-helix transcriptional regulator [Saccharothrix sp. BKS2]|uniref:Helix-turn-helix domain-containing protein n=1 Tax=Saccharothrix lopnurensis TaxID=1670621 RepID=A0ABW1P8Y5_9PSEU